MWKKSILQVSYSLYIYQISLLNTALSSEVQDAAKARNSSFASANPLALGSGGVGGRGSGMQTPLGWLTGKLTGVSAR